MRANPGDRIVVQPIHLDAPTRDGRVLAAQGLDGGPPYLVEWSEDGHVSLFFPGPDAYIHHVRHQR